MKWNWDGAISPISMSITDTKKRKLALYCAAVSSGYTAPVVQVCTLTPNICWSWRRSRKDWNMQKFFVVKSVNPLKSGDSKRPANYVPRPVNQYREKEQDQRCCRGGSRRLRGFNPPTPLPLGMPSENVMCIEKCHHVSRPTQYKCQ